MPRSLTANAADPEQVRAARAVEKTSAATRRKFYAAVMATYEGRFVLYDILRHAGIYSLTTTQAPDIYVQAGARNEGLRLLAMLVETNEALYLTMEREARARTSSEDRAIEAAQTAAASESTQ